MVCIIPVGSFEQHGPHLPPTVDAEIAQHVAKRFGGENRRKGPAPAVLHM